jgi:hypothetical protein
MSKPFSQDRKETAATVEDTAREILADHFDVPASRVVSAESEHSGEYDTRTLNPIQLLDFACVDWLVDVRPGIQTVAQRITPAAGSARMSIRTDNGSNLPCEADVLDTAGLTPQRYLFGWRDGHELTRAWILDTRETLKTMYTSIHTDHITNEDGTAAMYLDIGELAKAGCIIAGYEP